MKRKLALLLAIVMIVSTGFTAYATEPDNGAQMLKATTQPQTESQTEPGAEGVGQAGSAAGSVGLPGSSGSGENGDSETAQETSGQPETQAPDSAEGSSTPSGTQAPDSAEGSTAPSGTQAPDGAEGSPAPSGTQAPDGAEGSPAPSGTQAPDGAEGSTAPSGTQAPDSTDSPSVPTVTQGPGGQGAQLPGQNSVFGTRSVQGEAVLSGETGRIDVSITAALDLMRDVTFDVTISDGGSTQSGTVSLPKNTAAVGETSFEGLSDGEYTLTVSAPRFAVYTQKIRVEGKSYKVGLATGFIAGSGIEYAAEKPHPGVLVIGDVNGDGKVNQADRVQLIDAIDSGAGSDAFDLNGDGKTDLVDLEYFARAYNDPRDMQASVEESVPKGIITVAAHAGTTVEGELGALLESTGSVTLKPANGGAISDGNPVVLQFDFADRQGKNLVESDGIVIGSESDNTIGKAEIEVTYTDNGRDITQKYSYTDNGLSLVDESPVKAEKDSSGNILLHLGGQVAVKRVIIRIQGMLNNNNLAEIARVEFVNGMESRIPEPEMDIPAGMNAVPGSNKISLTWDPCINVTGYEVAIAIVQEDGTLGQWETIMVTGNALDVSSYGKEKLKNYQKYSVKVQSVNGTWRSGYGEAQTVIPVPKGKPDKPDMVKAVGKYKSIAVSWKDMEDTEYYRLFYKKETDAEYQEIGKRLETNSYVLEGLEDLTTYMIYVIGGNTLGESGPSLTATATTTDLNPPAMPKYKLINTGGAGQIGDHIISAGKGVRTGVTSMEDSQKDKEPITAWGTVDHDALSYYLVKDWDDGVAYPAENKGLIYEFDQAYEMDTISFHAFDSTDGGYAAARVCFWDADGKQGVASASLERKTDSDNRIYYVVRLAEPVNAKKIQLCIGRGNGYVRRITIAEVYFHYYDPLYNDIMGLYEDDLHTVLRPDVNQGTIDALRARINTPDEVSGEMHPDSELLKRELENAEQILNSVLSTSVVIHNAITTKGVSNVGGLNVWQPLGVTAAAGEEIAVYVGHSTKKTGENTELQLIATQYNAEADAMAQTVISTLKVGKNTVQIPKIWSLNYESGGALYVQYRGAGNATGEYAVRVSGGVQVPILDLYQVTDEKERLARTVAYVEKLKAYVSEMQSNHEKYHVQSGNKLVNYAYDVQTCILGASDIMLDTMMFSLPATQIWAGSGGNSGISTQAQAERILKSMDSMDEMMYLFYQHKGLNKNAPDAVNQIPAGHQNIRYQRMFAKAFMYASGNHIGIGWGSTAGMLSSAGVVFDTDGKYQSGSYFGWGIGHEIGHCINQGAYAVAEITNNYFSVLAQAQDRNDSVRFQYDKVYEKVTSGTKGRATNVFTQLGLYWQLHLAYDNGYNFKTYEKYEEQLNNLFFARVDTYARNTAKAPAPGGVNLTLESEEQNLMRLSCAAAEKNILDFFERWGMTPNEATRKYAEQFPVETRAICYANDDARVYRLTGSGSKLGTEGRVEAVSDTSGAKLVKANQIDFTLGYKNIPEADILGYEIVRCTISGGKTVEEPVTFVQGSTGAYSDVIATLNNRVVYYKITLVDKYLNRSAVKVTDSFKIEHDGSLSKEFWTVDTQNLTALVVNEDGSEVDEVITGSTVQGNVTGCEEDKGTDAVAGMEKDKLIDNQEATVYKARTAGAAQITLNFNRPLTVAGFKFTGVTGYTGTYKVQLVCSDGSEETVAEGTVGTQASQTLYFTTSDGKYVSAYEATAVRLILDTAAGSTVSIAELDVLGPTSDNVDFRRTEGDDQQVVIGKLSADFKYGAQDEDVIPKGSVVFAGSYKGNPAYNVVLLYDQDGNIVGKISEGELQAQQIILAHVPEDIEEPVRRVADGTWIYWVAPDTDLKNVTKVRAELYRVDDAQTNEGQRLVSDSLFQQMPEGELPGVTLDGVAEPWN